MPIFRLETCRVNFRETVIKLKWVIGNINRFDSFRIRERITKGNFSRFCSWVLHLEPPHLFVLTNLFDSVDIK